MSDDRKNSIENNREVFQRMTLSQRTEQRNNLSEMVNLPRIFRVAMRIKDTDVEEAKELIEIINQQNLKEIQGRRKKLAKLFP